MKNTLAILALLALCAIAPADCRRVVRVVQSHHVDTVVVAPVVAAVYAPIPVYSVGYQDNGTQQLLAEVRELRQQIQQLQAAPGTPASQKTAPPPANQHPGLLFLKQSCVACHDAQVSKAKGGGHAFFSAGELVNLSDAQRLAITTAVYSGRMPKGGKSTDEEVGALISFFDQKAAAVQATPPAK